MPKAPVVMSKPKSKEAAVIAAGASAPKTRVQLSMYTTPEVVDRIDTARKSHANLVLDRNQWLGLAVAEKLAKDGF